MENDNNTISADKIKRWNEQAGCPKNWKEAEGIENKMNEGKEWEPGCFVEQPVWKWDCNFKLDFDGPLARVSSRFYPPHINNVPGWEGDVSIMFFMETLATKKFQCETLEELNKQVEDYVKTVAAKIKAALS